MGTAASLCLWVGPLSRLDRNGIVWVFIADFDPEAHADLDLT